MTSQATHNETSGAQLYFSQDMLQQSSQKSDFSGIWQKSSQAGYRYFLPEDIHTIARSIRLPFLISKQLEQSSLALGKFSALIEKIPNPASFILAYAKKEATLSSSIEGTQTNIEDAFKQEAEVTPEKRQDWAEVAAYIRAADYAVKKLATFPLCNRLICDTHKVLMDQVRGKNKLPGEFRRSQNWIAGSRPENAHFVPPSHELIMPQMAQLEKFMQQQQNSLPHLIQAALIHYQFETIHPFLDGNGRMGRMLISLYLLEKKVIEQPILYISEFFENHRRDYYDVLNRARENQEGLIRWISFFLDGIEQTAQNGKKVTEKLIDLQRTLREQKIPNALGRRTEKGLRLLDFLFVQLRVNAESIRKNLGFGPQVTQNLLSKFTELGIIDEVTGYKRHRVYVFRKYLKLLIAGKEDEQKNEDEQKTQK